jgi:hypothetical protein
VKTLDDVMPDLEPELGEAFLRSGQTGRYRWLRDFGTPYEREIRRGQAVNYFDEVRNYSWSDAAHDARLLAYGTLVQRERRLAGRFTATAS